MKENVLLFHIGMFKTGTTSLQRFLYDNSELLKKYHWSYPKLDTTDVVWINGRKLGWDDGSAQRWETIKQDLKEHNVIISEEGYCYLLDKFFKVLSKAQEFHHNIKVIIYLRRQDRLAESMYNQDVKQLSEHSSFHEYMNDRIRFFVNYLELLDKISEKIGRENIIVRVYEKEQFEGERKDIFSDFIHSLPGPAVNLDWQQAIIPDRKNLSLNGNFYEIKKICNSIIENPCECWNREHFRAITQISGKKHTQNSKGLNAGYITKQERMDLLDSQAENNAEIARKYLNRENGELFYDKFLDYPVYQDRATDFEADMIQTLFTMIYKQQRKIEILPTVTAIFLLKKNKKLVLWGFGETGKRLYQYPLFPDAIIDNDPNKNHDRINNIPIIPSDEFKEWEESFVVVTPLFADGIEQELRSKGLKKGENYILMNDYYDYFSMF